MDLVRHNKTEHIYQVLDQAKNTTDSFHTDEHGNIPDDYCVVVYKRLFPELGSTIFVREINEFYQKFTPVTIEDIAKDCGEYLAGCIEELNYNSSDFDCTRCRENAKMLASSLLNYLKRL